MPIEPTEHDIMLRLRIGDDREGVNAKMLMRIMDAIEGSLYDSDRADVESISREIQLEPVVRDATLERLRNHRHERLFLTEAHSGSIELVALVVAVGLYLLKNTIGEAFKQGVAESEAFGRLKDLFRRSIDRKAEKLARSLQSSLSTRGINSDVEQRRGPNGERIIIVYIRSGRRPLGGSVPTLGDLLDS